MENESEQLNMSKWQKFEKYSSILFASIIILGFIGTTYQFQKLSNEIEIQNNRLNSLSLNIYTLSNTISNSDKINSAQMLKIVKDINNSWWESGVVYPESEFKEITTYLDSIEGEELTQDQINYLKTIIGKLDKTAQAIEVSGSFDHAASRQDQQRMSAMLDSLSGQIDMLSSLIAIMALGS